MSGHLGFSYTGLIFLIFCGFYSDGTVWILVDTLFPERTEIVGLLQQFPVHTLCRGNIACYCIFYAWDIWQGYMNVNGRNNLRYRPYRHTYAAQKRTGC